MSAKKRSKLDQKLHRDLVYGFNQLENEQTKVLFSGCSYIFNCMRA